MPSPSVGVGGPPDDAYPPWMCIICGVRHMLLCCSTSWAMLPYYAFTACRQFRSCTVMHAWHCGSRQNRAVHYHDYQQHPPCCSVLNTAAPVMSPRVIGCADPPLAGRHPNTGDHFLEVTQITEVLPWSSSQLLCPLNRDDTGSGGFKHVSVGFTDPFT